jgi:hypothetical protein
MNRIVFLLLGILLCMVSTQAQNSTFHGVFVGINDYPGLTYDLQYAESDASYMYYAMGAQGWSYKTLKLASQATESAIHSAIRALPQVNGDDETTGDTEMFFFSGHGNEEDGLVTVEGYLSITPSELTNDFGYNHANYHRCCWFLDACYSGQFPLSGGRGVVCASGGSQQGSKEDADLGHGVFTHYLLEGLENSRACGTDGIVSAEELFNYAAPLTNDYNPGQTPMMTDDWEGSEYLSANLNFKNSDNQAPAAPQNLSAQANPGNNHVLLTWDANAEEDLSLYEVWRDYHMDGWEWRVIATTTATSYVDNDYDYTHPYGLHGVNYKIRAKDNAANYSDFSNVVYRNLEPHDRRFLPEQPTAYNLEQNFPNPFNPSTVITYALPSPTAVRLSVFDMLGREVKVLVHGMQQPGFYEVRLDASDLPSGIYVYRIKAGEFQATRKLALVK